jgi:hypothetical protein
MTSSGSDSNRCCYNSLVKFLKSSFINRNTVAATMILLLAAACSGAPPETIPIEERMAEKGYLIKEPAKRLNSYRINGWSSVDRLNVIINVGASETYLLTVKSPCEGLNSAGHIAFSTVMGDLINKDKLIVRDYGGLTQNCFIDTIQTLEKIKHR